MSLPAAEPVMGSRAPPERIDDIDVVRGLALGGVALGNLLEIFRVPWVTGPYEVPDVGPADRAVEGILNIAFPGFMVTSAFSMLFGLGMVIAFDRARARGEPAYRRLARRQVVLFALGMAHATLLWNGDILSTYGMAGLCLLPLLGRSSRTLLLAALATFALTLVPLPFRPPSKEAGAQLLAQALEAYRHGNWLEVHAQRMRELPLVWEQVVIPTFASTLLSFFVGAAIGRSGCLFAPTAQRTRALRFVALLGLACLAFLAASYLHVLPRPPSRAWGMLRWLIFMASNVGLGLAYGAAILLLLRLPWGRRSLLGLAPLGRMALSNYIMHSVVFGFIFYGYGLGQYAKHGMASTAGLGLAVYALQIVLSARWLKHFRLGPFEWLWRSLSYGRREPFRRAVV
jgi:uncharacterized protein